MRLSNQKLKEQSMRILVESSSNLNSFDSSKHGSLPLNSPTTQNLNMLSLQKLTGSSPALMNSEPAEYEHETID